MSDAKWIQEMITGRNDGRHDTWRIRVPAEEQALSVSKQLAEHTEALASLQKKMERGDVHAVVLGLKEMRARMKKTIATLE